MDKLKLSDYGRIIKEYYLLASSSSNGTWFLESEAFKQGEYSKEDYLELVNDIEKMSASGVNDIDLIRNYEIKKSNVLKLKSRVAEGYYLKTNVNNLVVA